MNKVMFKKLTTAIPSLKKETLEQKDLEEIIQGLKKEGIYQALKESGQDPAVLAEITLTAFDEGIKTMRERLEKSLDAVVAEIAK